jgi:uncharacterized protein (TIGR02646 family)
MIRISKTLFPVPQVLQTAGLAAQRHLEAAYEQGNRTFTFSKQIYADAAVKHALISIQHYKCCFCESKIGHIDDGDVEHFRPKAASRQATGAPFIRPGYYWLAYQWDNLFLACTKCNQRHKANFFPLQTPATRALSHRHNVGAEDPLFLHPERDDPAEHLSFHHENIVPVANSPRGRATIEGLRLDRTELTQHRAETLSTVKALFEVMALFPEDPLRQKALNILRLQRSAHTAEKHQYAGMFRAFFHEHPVP